MSDDSDVDRRLRSRLQSVMAALEAGAAVPAAPGVPRRRLGPTATAFALATVFPAIAMTVILLAGVFARDSSARPQVAGPSSVPSVAPPSTFPTVPPPATPTPRTVLTGLHMVSATVGWALEDRSSFGLGVADKAVIRTEDGGHHWRSPLPGSRVFAADFHDSDHVWVATAAPGCTNCQSVIVAATRDAGSHWSTTSPVEVTGTVAAIQFVDDMHGWLFGSDGTAAAGNAVLYRTIDGGGHWTAVPTRNRAGAAGLPQPCPRGGPIAVPVFLNASTGWVGAFCDQLYFEVTHDGGMSWATQTVPHFPGPSVTGPAQVPGGNALYDVSDVHFTTATDGALLVNRGFTTGANALQDAALYVTRDAGASWAAIRLPADALHVGFIDTAHGWMVVASPGGDVGNQSLWTTASGGASWEPVQGAPIEPGSTVTFVDTRVGFATSVHGETLRRTDDGGRTWTAVPVTIG